MSYEVVVVGGGIGGLTVAALLSARGMNTCLLERQSQVGGCIARVEFSGFDFEPGMGLYTSFGPGEVYERLFSQLPVEIPAVTLLTEPYVSRRIDGTDVSLDEARLYSIAGGPATLAERLAESIKLSGSKVRLNSPVLRLSFDPGGKAVGVDLLSGETVLATKAIVSNLTVWDTYGKLVGLNRTPPEIKKQINALRGAGAYLIYAAMEESAVSRLPSERMLVRDDEGEFSLAVSSSKTAPVGKRAVTLKCETEIESWFSYQTSEEDYEEWDQAALEHFWKRLHAAIPELGADIEIIETANPRTYYDLTRRKLGMVLGLDKHAEPLSHRTFLPNVFMVGDTISSAGRLDSVVASAISLANEISEQD
jgi:phytoene dehydrogenase-like protein